MEVESFQQQALAVRMPCDDFDFSIEPSDGEEYLMKVIYERSHCPAVVFSEKNLSTTSSTVPNPAVSDITIDTYDKTLRPSAEWKEVQLKDFVKLRRKISTYRAKYVLTTNNCTSKDLVPPIDDEDGWKVFCQDEPFLSTVLLIDQRMWENLLEFLSNWLRPDSETVDSKSVELSGKDSWLGNWIYSALVCLHLPLEPSVHSVLRDIAKSSILLRNKVGRDRVEEATPFNLFIFLISKFFDQLDLADFV